MTARAEDALGPAREVSLPAGTIRYRERGSGDPIVFVHGLLVNGLLWRKVVPSLAAQFRCITPDWPLGAHELPMESDADLTLPGLARLVADFIRELGLGPTILVGNDTGGAVCQVVATEHADVVSRLVLTPCDCYDNFLPPIFRYLQWIGHVPGGVWAAAQTLRVPPLRRLPIAFGWLAKRPVERAVVDAYLRHIQGDSAIRRDLSEVLKRVSTRYTLAAARAFSSLQRPVLLAWAEEDRLFPFSFAERMAKELPDVRLRPIRDSYTFVAEDQPEQLAAMIAEFLSETAR